MSFKLERPDHFKGLSLGKPRPYFVGGVRSNMLVINIIKTLFQSIIVQTPRFTSFGFVKSKGTAARAGDDRPVITCDSANSSFWLLPLMNQLRQALSSILKQRLAEYRREVEGRGAQFPGWMLPLLEEVESFWPGPYPDGKDACFLRVEPDAILIVEECGKLVTKKVSDYKGADLPGRGVYKAQLQVRYLLIQPEAASSAMRPRITTNLIITQLAFIPDVVSVPSEIVLDLSDMFPTLVGKPKEQYIDISDEDEDDQRPQGVLRERHWLQGVESLKTTALGPLASSTSSCLLGVPSVPVPSSAICQLPSTSGLQRVVTAPSPSTIPPVTASSFLPAVTLSQGVAVEVLGAPLPAQCISSSLAMPLSSHAPASSSLVTTHMPAVNSSQSTSVAAPPQASTVVALPDFATGAATNILAPPVSVGVATNPIIVLPNFGSVASQSAPSWADYSSLEAVDLDKNEWQAFFNEEIDGPPVKQLRFN